MTAYRWWSQRELAATTETVPEDLVQLLARVPRTDGESGDRHVLSEHLAQIGTQARVLDGGTTGQLRVDLDRQLITGRESAPPN